jgi:Pyridoxamine 5'-phosphate oxidase
MSVPVRPAPVLSEEIAELLASGVDIYVATRDANLAPESMLAMGLKVHADRCSVTLYLPQALAQATLRNLDNNAQIAITLSRPSDYNTVQLKGRAGLVRQSGPADRDLQVVHRAALVEQLAGVGIPRSATRRLVWWPSVAVEVEVNAVFAQTPGPHAGEPISGS